MLLETAEKACKEDQRGCLHSKMQGAGVHGGHFKNNVIYGVSMDTVLVRLLQRQNHEVKTEKGKEKAVSPGLGKTVRKGKTRMTVVQWKEQKQRAAWWNKLDPEEQSLMSLFL